MLDIAPPASRRPADLRRSWLFLPGADRDVLEGAANSGADVAIQELEDFTVPARRPAARALCAGLFDRWRSEGLIAAIRINPLETADGPLDLEAAMAARPDVVLMPKCSDATQIARLDAAIGAAEARYGIPAGFTEIVPNIESARGLVNAGAIAAASPRVTAMLVASEDMSADLGAERSRGGSELAYVRQRFLIECVAAGVVAIDCPYTYSDPGGVETETRAARGLGYRAKSLVESAHAAIVNAVLTPSADEVRTASRLVAAFDDARSRGAERGDLDGHRIEVPTYHAALRLLARARTFAAFEKAGARK